MSVAYNVVEGLILNAGYPYYWPLFIQGQEFTDFTIYLEKFHYFHHAAFFTTGYPFSYPAPMALLYALFFCLPPTGSLWLFLAVMCISFVLPAALFQRALRARGLAPRAALAFVGIVLVSSWPAALLFDRGNVEVFVWIAVASAVWALVTGREWLAAALFAVAASLKLFPIFFLALFLSRRRFPKLLFGAAVFTAVTLVSLAVLGPTVPLAYQGIAGGLHQFNVGYTAIYSRAVTGFDHSTLGLLKTVVVLKTNDDNTNLLLPLTSRYMPIMAVLGAVLYLWRIRTLPWLNQLILLSVASILFTPFSGDGTLIHLYGSFALCCFLALAAWQRRVRVQGLPAVLLCYAWLFTYESFEILAGRRVQAQGKCLALMLLFGLAMRYPLGAPLDRSAGPQEMRHPEPKAIEGVMPA